MKYKALIVDDEYPARKLLEQYLKTFDNVELVALCANAEECKQQLKSNRVDLLFLDIQMPGITGIELLRSMSNKPEVIITTAYPNYAIEGFDLQVCDYLLKPISPERFKQAVDKATGALKKQQTADEGEEPYIMIKADHKLTRVMLEDIKYIEGLREYVSIYTETKRHIVLEALKNLEATLPEKLFARVHRSYIVAKKRVDSISGTTLELEGKKIPIGKSYKESVQQWFK